MKELKVLSVCGMGFGTSLMTFMNVQELGEKHGVTVTGEACDLGSYMGRPCDVIVASSEIAAQIQETDIPVVAINNILDKDELEQKMLPYFNK
jgi:PTS system ascorbate-specific IIB component